MVCWWRWSCYTWSSSSHFSSLHTRSTQQGKPPLPSLPPYPPYPLHSKLINISIHIVCNTNTCTTQHTQPSRSHAASRNHYAATTQLSHNLTQPPRSYHAATTQLPRSHHAATTQPPRSHHAATTQPPRSHHAATAQPPRSHNTIGCPQPFTHVYTYKLLNLSCRASKEYGRGQFWNEEHSYSGTRRPLLQSFKIWCSAVCGPFLYYILASILLNLFYSFVVSQISKLFLGWVLIFWKERVAEEKQERRHHCARQKHRLFPFCWTGILSFFWSLYALANVFLCITMLVFLYNLVLQTKEGEVAQSFSGSEECWRRICILVHWHTSRDLLQRPRYSSFSIFLSPSLSLLRIIETQMYRERHLTIY